MKYIGSLTLNLTPSYILSMSDRTEEDMKILKSLNGTTVKFAGRTPNSYVIVIDEVKRETVPYNMVTNVERDIM